MKCLGLRAIPLDLIDIGERLRAIDENYAALLAENIQQTGRMRSPVDVRTADERFTLIAGGHRIHAAQLLGWTEVEAFVYEASAPEAEMAEIDENLVRHDLNPLDRAVFLWRRKELYEHLHPEAKRGGDRRSEKSKAHDEPLIGFARETAEKANLSLATVKRAISIAQALQEDIRKKIAGTSLARKQSELQALSKMPASQQAAVVEQILNGQAHSVGAARALVSGTRPEVETPEQKQLKRLMDAWFAAKSPSARKAFRDFILGQKDGVQ